MGQGLYLHIPFCAKRCPYCDFAFVVRARPPFERFTTALVEEAGRSALEPAETVYFGGGTPSLLPPEQLQRILAAIPTLEDAEITLEANPEDAGHFDAYADVGVNRLSLGVQALTDPVLKTLGRIHDAAAARRALEAATARFDNVSADLIFGVPGLKATELLESARVLVASGVSHISAYGLTVHEGTLLAKARAGGRFRETTDETHREHFLRLHEFLTANGFEHYEVSNYARPGRRSRHNERYWTGKSYTGLGPSAHGFDAQRSLRYWNERRLDRWMTAVEQGRPAVVGEEYLSQEARRLEMLYLGLRRSEGVPIGLLAEYAASPEGLDRLVSTGLAQNRNDRFMLTPEGLAVADEVVHHLL